MSKRVFLITGGAGFVGHHMVEHILRTTVEDQVIVMDSLTYSGSLERLRSINVDPFNNPRFKYLSYDFRLPAEQNLISELKNVTHVLHMGAESHVDHSISDPLRFVQANVVGTTNVLNLARKLPKLELFVYFSTDEVFGPAPMHKFFAGFNEHAKHNPKNPYAASKSAAEMIVVSFANTYKLPCIITRQMNIFGERQHPEKFIPMVIRAAINGGLISIHSTPDKQQAGMRYYIHARNVANAHLFLFDNKPWLNTKSPRDVESYHIVGELEVDNLTLANAIQTITKELCDERGLDCVGAKFEMVDFHSSRPGHDLRYALDGSKMKEIGWVPPKTFEESLRKTIAWYLGNQEWLEMKGPQQE